ncbi:MAG: hypothetical protein U0169_08370 [Polyangiaceae bacterium]
MRSRPAVRSLAAVAVLVPVVVFAGASAGCKKKEASAWKLPVDAKELPPTTTRLDAELIEGTRETDPTVKNAYTAAELGSAMCRKGAPDPARTLELMNLFGARAAKKFFTAETLDQVQALLQCGDVLAKNLQDGHRTAISFADDKGAKTSVDTLHLGVQDLPPKFGLTKHSFGTSSGFCRTSDPQKPAVILDCTPQSEAALVHESTWFLGKRGDLDSVARTIAAPRADLSTSVAALNDAANQMEGLGAMRIEADLKSAKSFLSAPCSWGGMQSGGNLVDFMQSCFPSTADKIVQEIDSKLRAAGFELEPDTTKAGAVRGGIVLVARDDDAAKVVEKDAISLVAEWKSQLENNEAKLIRQAKENPQTLRQKSWAIVVDDFVHALQKTKVGRDGRTVKLTFDDPLDADDKRDLDEAKKQSLEQQRAIAEVLVAVQAKETLPLKPMIRLFGVPWASYLVHAAVYDPKAIPPECAAAKAGAAKVAPTKGAAAPAAQATPNPRCVAPVEPAENLFGDKKPAVATK